MQLLVAIACHDGISLIQADRAAIDEPRGSELATSEARVPQAKRGKEMLCNVLERNV